MTVIRDAEKRTGSVDWFVASIHGTSQTSSLRSALPRPQAPSSILSQIAPYIAIARPDHWFKNVFMGVGVLLAYFCHPETFGQAALVQLLWAAAATCLLASSNYVLNEILDGPSDRHHPVKCRRPIPSRRISTLVAYAEWLLIGAFGLALASSLNRPFFCSGLFLLIMGVVYNVPPIRSKDLPYLDVLTESINNPIRLLLGWFAVTSCEFPPVSLLIAYWMIGAFFMASKRFAEYRSIAHRADAAAYRFSFQHYNEHNLLISMCFYATCFALFLGVFIIRYHLELILIVPLVAGFVSYYLHIALKEESAAQSPEKLYRERGLMAYLAICVMAFTVLMFVQIPDLYEWFNVVPSSVPTLWRF
jgi:decaprenyl-phosphate phosphoribosyltransferase